MNDQRYVGPSDVHDATVLRVKRDVATLVVTMRSYEGLEFDLQFHGVTDVESREPEGMIVYALSQYGAAGPPPHRFIFANWDEEDSSSLEVTAEGFDVVRR